MNNLQFATSELKANRLRDREQAYRQAYDDVFSQTQPVTDQYWQAMLSERRCRGSGHRKDLDRVITAVDRVIDQPKFEYKGYYGCAIFDQNKLFVYVLYIPENVAAQCNDVRRAEFTFKELVRDYLSVRKS